MSAVSLSGPATGDQGTRSFLVTFSKPVVGFGAASITPGVTAGMPAATLGTIVAVGASSYSVPITNVSIASGSGTLSMSINPSGIADTLGNALSAAMPTIPSYAVVPVPSLLSLSTAAASPTNAGGLSYTATFNVPVSGLVVGQFATHPTGTATATVSGVSPGGLSSTFTVSLSPVAGDGTLALGITTTAGLTDAFGDAVAASTLDQRAYHHRPHPRPSSPSPSRAPIPPTRRRWPSWCNSPNR